LSRIGVGIVVGGVRVSIVLSRIGVGIVVGGVRVSIY